MEKKITLKFVVILLSLFLVAAVPATRSLMTKNLGLDIQAKEDLVMDLWNNKKHFEMKEGVEEGRMMMDLVDYPGTGPNKHHDPKSPGRA